MINKPEHRLDFIIKPEVIFSVLYIVMAIIAFLPSQSDETNLIKSYINYHGIIFHFSCVIFFVLGSYIATRNFNGIPEIKLYVINFKMLKFVILGFCLFSVFVVIWQVSLSINILTYIKDSLFFKADPVKIRDCFLKTSEKGGLSGIIKMFSYLPLSAVYLLLVADYLNRRQNNNIKIGFWFYFAIIIISMIVRAAFSLDRLLLASTTILLFYYMLFEKKINFRLVLRFKIVFISICVFAMLAVFCINYISLLRQNKSFFAVLQTYLSLGLANLSVLFNGNYNCRFGQETFFVLKFPLEYFGFNSSFGGVNCWVWNPAGYLSSYVYQDFWLFGLLMFSLFGYFTKNIYLKAECGYGMVYFILNLALTMVLFSVVVVPVFRGPEWWVSLISAIIASFFIFNKRAVYD